ncbi:uncharacterized protein C6orf132 homolog [Rhinophrynus dorsalis]
MKKNSSMQGTLSKLFGKKNANNNSLYAENPPWILSQGSKKGSVDYHDGTLNSYSFLDDSGTATLKARPGPRARPLIQISTSYTETQGLAVPTPSVPAGFNDSATIGNGPKLNGNYRMYNSVGDLRLNNYYDFDEDIPAPPSMPPPPPPTMPPPPPPQESSTSPTMSSPSSPSPPDFIPPTPNSSASVAPRLVPPPVDPIVTGVDEQQQLQNASKWKSETLLNTLPGDLPKGLPNRFSLNPDVFQHTRGQTNYPSDPHSTLPRSFKVPPPAPARTSSMQLQESMAQQFDNPSSNNSSKGPLQSPVPSSFNPTVQAKLFSIGQGQTAITDAINKRKSMIIMDTQTINQSMDQGHINEKRENIQADIGGSGSPNLKGKFDVQLPSIVKSGDDKSISNRSNKEGVQLTISKESELHDDGQKQINKTDNVKSEPASVVSCKSEASKHPQSSAVFNRTKFSKDIYPSEGSKSPKPTVKVFSIKPITGENGSMSNSFTHSKMDSMTEKDRNAFQKGLVGMENEIKLEPGNDEKHLKGAYLIKPPTTPPPMAPPPPPIMAPPNPPSMAPPPPPPLTAAPTPPMIPPTPPPKIPSTTNVPAPPPAPPLVAPLPIASRASPLLTPKAATSQSPPGPPLLVPPPPPPKAPPAPPPLPPPAKSSNGSSPLALHKALQAKEEHLKSIPKKDRPFEIRPAEPSFKSSDNDQKNRAEKIKEELEAFLSSPKKDNKKSTLKNSKECLEINTKTPKVNVSPLKGGENTLVNSLMLKVPLLPPKPQTEDTEADTSEWFPKSSKTDIAIPEPDYLPASNQNKDKQKTESPPNNKQFQSSNMSPISISPPKPTDVSDIVQNPVPSYKPHHERKASAGSLTFNTVPCASKPDPVSSLKPDHVPEPGETESPSTPSVTLDSRLSQQDEHNHPVTVEKTEDKSPMALLMAAKKRAQKGSRIGSTDRNSLPKVSVTNGLITSSFGSQYNEAKQNTFVVVPKKENMQQIVTGGVPGYLKDTSFASSLSSSSEQLINKSSWRDEEFQTSNLSGQVQVSQQSSDDMLHSMSTGINSKTDVQLSSDPQVNAINDKYWERQSDYEEQNLLHYTNKNPVSSNLLYPSDTTNFNISSFPSPTPASVAHLELDYEIIPPPAEFMNSPIEPNENLNDKQQNERPFAYGNSTNIKSDFGVPKYEYNYIPSQPIVTQTQMSIRDSNQYPSDNYSTGISRDSHKGSLIKKRLYMPEPESSRNYSKNSSSLRSSALPISYNHMHAQSSSTMGVDPWRSNTTSRYITQGRRVSTENINRMVPPMNDLRYKPQNLDYSVSKSSRPQNTYQGMTFTVRPGTRQPISNTYQGGYL